MKDVDLHKFTCTKCGEFGFCDVENAERVKELFNNQCNKCLRDIVDKDKERILRDILGEP